jgi:peptidoglycan hydrolase-like protein with peptidoglycan-binding domain
MSFINWGNESESQRAARARAEMEALYEQAVRLRMQSQGGVGGAAGGGGPVIPNPSDSLSSFFILVKEDGQTNYTYYIADYSNLTFSGPFDTGINYSEYFVDGEYSIYNKGYFVLFRLTADSNNYKMLFMDRLGNILSTPTGVTSDLLTYNMEGQWVVATDYDERLLWYFDGETVTENFTYLQGSSSFNIGTNRDPSCDLGFGMTVVNPGGDNKICFVDNLGVKELFSYDTDAQPDLNYTYQIYNRSNKAVVYEYDNSLGYYTSLRFFDLLTGLQDGPTFDASSGNYDSFDSFLYGDGNFAFLFYNATEYLVVIYTASTGTVSQLTVNKTIHPQWWVDYDTFSYFDCNDYPINNTISFVFWAGNGDDLNNLTGMSACRAVYSTNNSTLMSAILKKPGQLPDIRLSNPVIGKDYIFAVTDPGDSEYSVLVLNPNVFNSLDTGITLAEAPTWAIDRAGEKVVLKFYTTGNKTEAFVVNSNGSSLTNTSIPVPNLNNISVDYDVFLTENSNESTWWKLNNSSDTFIELPRPDNWYSGDPYTNSQLREIGIITAVTKGKVIYTHTQMSNVTEEALPEDFVMDGSVVAGTADNFGLGSSYFTNLYPGMFVLCAKDMNINKFGIIGNIGADGGGLVDGYDFTVTHLGQTYHAYVKRVYDSGDPSINQIILLKGTSGSISQNVDFSSEDDTHVLTGIPSSITELHYLLLAQQSDRIEDAVVADIIDDYLTIVHNKSIAQTLTDLNSNYETVTDNVLTPYLFNDNPDGDPPSTIGDGGGDMYDGANIIITDRNKAVARIMKANSVTAVNDFKSIIADVEIGINFMSILYEDETNDNKYSFEVRDHLGNIRYTVQTPHYEWSLFTIVGDRFLVITYEKTFDGFDFYTNTNAYIGNLDSYELKTWTSFSDQPSVRRMPNDTTWWD